MGKMVFLCILLTTTISISAIIVYVTYSGIEIQEYLPPWHLAVHFTLCLLTHTKMVSTDTHTHTHTCNLQRLDSKMTPCCLSHNKCTCKIKLICIHEPYYKTFCTLRPILFKRNHEITLQGWPQRQSMFQYTHHILICT
jgi:hypothetical protein